MSNPNSIHLAPYVTYSELDWTPDQSTAAGNAHAQALADAAAKKLSTQTYVVTRTQYADFTWWSSHQEAIRAAQMLGTFRLIDG